jgi:hypothetical protein
LDKDDNIVGNFEDKVSNQLTKRFRFKITDKSIEYKLLNPNDVDFADDSELLEFALGKEFKHHEPKRKNCKKGFSCGASCIARWKTCWKDMTPRQRQQALRIRRELRKMLKSQPSRDLSRFSSAQTGLERDNTKSDNKQAGTVNKVDKEPNLDRDNVQNIKSSVDKPNKSNLKVVGDTELLKSKFLEDWGEARQEIRELLNDRGQESFDSDYKYLSSDRLRAIDLIGNLITSEFSSEEDNFLGVTGSEKNNLQGIAVFKNTKDSLYIDYLMTAPWNNLENPKVRGAGTALIIAAIRKSKELGHEGRITLEPLDDAIPFYEKLGFKMKKGRLFEGKMTLSEAEAKALLDKEKTRGRISFGEEENEEIEAYFQGLENMEINHGCLVAKAN